MLTESIQHRISTHSTLIENKEAERQDLAAKIKQWKRSGGKIEKIAFGVTGIKHNGATIDSKVARDSAVRRERAIKALKLAARQNWGREGKAT